MPQEKIKKIRSIVLPGKKEASLLNWTLRRPVAPARVRIPLDVSGALPCVSIGQRVRTGEKIAEPSSESGVAVHASLSGEVAAIDFFDHPLFGTSQAIEIISDTRDEKMPAIGQAREQWEFLPQETLLKIFQDAGLVDEETGKGLHAFAFESAGPTLILSGCEPEPYVTSSHALMLAHPVEILRGAEILRKAFGAEKILIVVETSKEEIAETLKSKLYFLKWEHASLQMIPNRYPLGQALFLKKQFGEDFLVFNVGTAFAAYEAVALQKPFYERATTVAGECVIEPKNLWARTGASLDSLIKACRGFMRAPRKLVINGPMKGRALEHLNFPVTKQTTAVLALPHEIARPENVQACTQCGDCVENCPAGISPVMIALASERNYFELADEYGAKQCVECGICSYVCSSDRPMLQLIRYALSRGQETVETPKIPTEKPIPAVI